MPSTYANPDSWPVTCMRPEEKSKRSKTAHYDPERAEAFRIAMIEHPISVISQMFEDGRMDDDGDLMNMALEMAHDCLDNLMVAYADNPEIKARRARRARKGV